MKSSSSAAAFHLVSDGGNLPPFFRYTDALPCVHSNANIRTLIIANMYFIPVANTIRFPLSNTRKKKAAASSFSSDRNMSRPSSDGWYKRSRPRKINGELKKKHNAYVINVMSTIIITD